jgi:hypothetical protein
MQRTGMSDMTQENRARPLPELLREWAEWAERRRSGEPIPLPTVTLHMRSGRDLCGIVMDLADKFADKHVVLGLKGLSSPAPPAEFSYVPVSGIEAITLHGFGAGEPVETVPGLLSFRRSIGEWQEALKKEFGTPILVAGEWKPEDLGALEALRQNLSDLAISWVAEPARTAVVDRIRQIELTVGAKAEVSLNAGRLRIVTTRQIADRLRPGELKSAIEDLL